jgi:hypothetical protein
MVVFSLAMDGNECSANTLANLDAASEEYRRQRNQGHKYDLIVFTGGIFTDGQNVPAATAMAKWWQENWPAWTTPVLIETGSLITRQNVINTLALLADTHRFRMGDLKLTVVSERWHLLGIQLLFLLLCHKWTRAVASNFRITSREKLARLARLPMYLWDPHGVGWLSRRKIRERGG